MRAFKSPIFDQYGAAEQACFISQCEQGSYHVHPEFGVTEFLPDKSLDRPSHCRIIATGFTNWAMPLLRYDTGDVAVPSDRRCACTRNFQVVEELVGRLDDLLITPDGRRIGRLDPVFKGLDTIQRAQIVQESADKIRVRLVPGRGFIAAHQESLRRELAKRLGDDMRIVFEIVDDIPVGPGGKFRAVVCRLEIQGRPEVPMARAQ